MQHLGAARLFPISGRLESNSKDAWGLQSRVFFFQRLNALRRCHLPQRTPLCLCMPTPCKLSLSLSIGWPPHLAGLLGRYRGEKAAKRDAEGEKGEQCNKSVRTEPSPHCKGFGSYTCLPGQATSRQYRAKPPGPFFPRRNLPPRSARCRADPFGGRTRRRGALEAWRTSLRRRLHGSGWTRVWSFWEPPRVAPSSSSGRGGLRGGFGRGSVSPEGLHYNAHRSQPAGQTEGPSCRAAAAAAAWLRQVQPRGRPVGEGGGFQGGSQRRIAPLPSLGCLSHPRACWL